MNWTEEATQKMDEILASLPSKLQPPARCKAVKGACPYKAPEKVRAWKALAKSRVNPERSTKPLVQPKYRGDDAQEAWIAKNLR